MSDGVIFKLYDMIGTDYSSFVFYYSLVFCWNSEAWYHNIVCKLVFCSNFCNYSLLMFDFSIVVKLQ